MIRITRRQVLATAVAGCSVLSSGCILAAEKKAIVIVYSRTGNTLSLARSVEKATGADFLQLEVKDPYAASYSDMTGVARGEKRNGKRREIKTLIPDLSQYDTIYLGSPYWWGGLSVPMWTFLSDHPLDGKTVYPFITSGSSSAEGAVAEIKALCPKAKVMPEFHATSSDMGSAATDIVKWLKR